MASFVVEKLWSFCKFSKWSICILYRSQVLSNCKFLWLTALVLHVETLPCSLKHKIASEMRDSQLRVSLCSLGCRRYQGLTLQPKLTLNSMMPFLQPFEHSDCAFPFAGGVCGDKSSMLNGHLWFQHMPVTPAMGGWTQFLLWVPAQPGTTDLNCKSQT